MKLSDLNKPGIAPLTQFPMLFDSRRGEPLFLAQNGAQSIPQDNPQTAANIVAWLNAYVPVQ